MKKIAFLILLLTASQVAAGYVPRISIQHPRQARVFLYPPVCESMILPSIPNRGVIYAQIYTANADALYIEFNGAPIKDETGTIIYNPKFNPDHLEIIPIYIEVQNKASIITARAVNDNGSNTVYAAFIPVPAGQGEKVATFGCTTMY